MNKVTESKELIDAVQTGLPGYTAAKCVEKPKSGFGIWLGEPIDGRTPRVTVTADKLNKPEQIVYLTIQLLPPGVTK